MRRVDPTLLQLLELALDKEPDQVGVRLHLAELLLSADRPQEALGHASRILESSPADAEALLLAARAAESCGKTERASGYRRLAQALAAADTDDLPGADSAGASVGQPVSQASAPSGGEPFLSANDRAQAGDHDPSGDPSQAPARAPEMPAPQNAASAEDRDAEPEEAEDVEETVEGDPVERDPVERDPGGRVLPMRLVRSRGNDDDVDPLPERPRVTLEDVAGLAEVKRRLELAFLAPLRNPELREMYGKSLKGGLLLYGPPGCGKTYVARALAGELGAAFLSVGLNDLLDQYVGGSEKHIHQLFARARRSAPCVLFIDELDALGRKRSLARHSAWLTSAVNQLLSELDGAQADNEGVFVLAATNHPWDVDTALRRPGRLDRMVLVLPPDEPARRHLLELALAKKPTEGIDVAWVAKRSDGFSGADLVHLVDSATELAMEDSLKTGNTRPVAQKDMKRALSSLKPSTRPWLEVARNHALFANASGDYDELTDYLRRVRLI